MKFTKTAPPSKGKKDGMGAAKILIVEDEPNMVAGLRDNLSGSTCAARTARVAGVLLNLRSSDESDSAELRRADNRVWKLEGHAAASGPAITASNNKRLGSGPNIQSKDPWYLGGIVVQKGSFHRDRILLVI
jgi:hypothetical protein